MGGACLPTHVKLSPPPGCKAECVIINAVECEMCIRDRYNYAEFYTVASKQTDADGKTFLTAGKGDMLV